MLAEYTSTQSCYYSPLLDPSLAENYPEWDEGYAGTDETTGGKGTDYEDQGEMGAIFDAWDE